MKKLFLLFLLLFSAPLYALDNAAITAAGDKYIAAINTAAKTYNIADTDRDAIVEGAKRHIKDTVKDAGVPGFTGDTVENKAPAGNGAQGNGAGTEGEDGAKDDGSTAPDAADTQKHDPQQLADLQKNASAMTAKDTESRVLTAVSNTGLGVGGAQLGQALSEQSQDKTSLARMQTLLDSMRCDWGSHTVKAWTADGKGGGSWATSVPVDPDGRANVDSRDYANLACKIKFMKDSLGLKKGLESETDVECTEDGHGGFHGRITASTDGLYANQQINRGQSTFGSLATALSDTNSRDAQMRTAQQKATSDREKAGIAVAAVGGAAMLGNAAVVNNWFGGAKESSAEINAKWEKLRQSQKTDLEQKINNNVVPQPPQVTCGQNTCSIIEGTKCIGIETDKKADSNGNCICIDQSQNFDENWKCVAAPAAETNENQNEESGDKISKLQPPVTGLSKISDLSNLKNAAIPSINTSSTDTINTMLASGNLFENGKDVITDDAKKIITNWAQTNKDTINSDAVGCISIVGHTDNTTFKSGKGNNQSLSFARAMAVKDLLSQQGIAENRMTAQGVGPQTCTDSGGNPLKGSQPDCRKVEITTSTASCSV